MQSFSRQPDETGDADAGLPFEPFRAPRIDARLASREPDWSPELTHEVYDLVCSDGLAHRRVDRRLRRLEARHGPAVYAALIFILSHLCLDEQAAARHWERILDHRDQMQRRLGSPVDLRVALVSYFTSVDQLLKNPKVIEMRDYEETRDHAYRDALTGARNFRYLAEFLPQEIARSDQYYAPLSLLMIDVDDFKVHNDRFGHDVGNRSLISIVGLLTERLRRVDVLARYGGEEFALVLPSTPKSAAGEVADRMRAAVESHRFDVDDDEPVGLTVSLGVATYPADADTAHALVRCADEALYRAKECGKNQVRYFGSSRRSYRRIVAELPGQFCAGGESSHPLTTVNVSIGGILFRSAKRPAPNALVEARVELPENQDGISASGRIVSVEPVGNGLFETAMRIVEIGAADRFALAAYLRRHVP